MRVVLYLIFVLSSCSTQNLANQLANNEQEVSTVDIIAIEKALNVSEFKQYLHLEIPNRNNISFYSPYLLSPNDTERFELFSNNVKVIAKKDIEENKNLIKLMSAKLSENKLILTFDYKIEGVFLHVLLRINEGNYTVENYKITEQ